MSSKKPKIRVPEAKSGRGIQSPVAAPISDISFNFRYLATDLTTLSYADLKAFVKTITRLSTMKWAEICLLPRENGKELIPKKQISGHFPTAFSAEANILSVRFTQIGRILGFAQPPIFYVVWVDADGSLYAH